MGDSRGRRKAAAVTVSVRHTTAPSIVLAQGVGTQGGFYLSGVVVRFLVEATPGVLVPVFSTSLSAGADVEEPPQDLPSDVVASTAGGAFPPSAPTWRS